MQELVEALHTYRESLAELDSIRHTSQSVADSQEVYNELQEAIVLTEEAVTDLQSTEALKRGRQSTTDLATEPVLASEAVSVPVQANPTNVQPLPQTTLVALKAS
ncbi:hypothetical protein ABBQ38_012378 [Trebouxia sp. C0009 RCD-2024]